ncbi:hypothetical protein [Paraferrimonas sedimenticola]|uniref:Uncharacterized protein n=1 Tax=Paraferrimonas sedimenticola TaxID=375674 RepID=A0AA37VVF3_9GAMM|nr:hypothetical protein [Paraferrimonas sedimenticola]GLP96026.1 hypothetical protein GCM10007895_13320 [Paraferrimonas sedimenticola]
MKKQPIGYREQNGLSTTASAQVDWHSDIAVKSASSGSNITSTNTNKSISTQNTSEVAYQHVGSDPQSFAQLENSLPGDAGKGTAFNGVDSYISFAPWKATGNVRIQAWLGELGQQDDGSYHWTHVVASDNSHESIRIDRYSAQIQIGTQYPGIYQAFDFAETRYVQVDVEPGKLTISDGIRSASIEDQSIQPDRLEFDQFFLRDGQYSKGIVQAISLQELSNSGNTVNYRAYGFESMLPDTGTQFNLVNVEHIVPDGEVPPPCEGDECPEPPPNPCVDDPNNCLPGYDLDMSNSPVKTQADWDTQFLALYPNHKPVMNITVGDDTGRFAWEAPIWLKTYVIMATTYQDDKYIDWAVELVDHLFHYTDEKRQARGEINVSAEPYWQAPKHYMNNPGTPAPGWRHYNPKDGKDWRVQALQDGRVLSGVMSVVDYIKGFGLTQYDAKVDQWIAEAKRIVDSHDTSYSETKQSSVAGSYYYPNDNSADDDSGLHSRPIPFNHNLSQAYVQMVMDKWSGGTTNYSQRVQNLLKFFSDYLERKSDGSCEWRYQAHTTDPNTKFEDFNHGDIDIEFLVKAHREGVNQDESMMQCITKSVTGKMHNQGTYTDLVNGTGTASGDHQINSGWHWIELHQYDSQVAYDVHATLTKHGNSLSWYGTYMAWANMLRMTHKP